MENEIGNINEVRDVEEASNSQKAAEVWDVLTFLLKCCVMLIGSAIALAMLTYIYSYVIYLAAIVALGAMLCALGCTVFFGLTIWYKIKALWN